MAEIRFVESADHTTIAYDVAGGGPAIILLHGGFIQSRQDWHEAGYVERLSKDYTVISIDLRGHGESDRPSKPEGYLPERLIEDVRAVIKECNISQFCLWGYSLGGSVGLQIASRMKEIIGAILVGVWFGKLFTPETTAEALGRIESVERAIKEGVFDQVEMPPSEKDFFSKVDISLMKNFGRALAAYPPIKPADLLCPALMVAGTANQSAASKLKEYENDMCNAGVAFRFFEGLGHYQEFTEVDTILPECLSFLHNLKSHDIFHI